RATLRVFDVKGRLIKILADGILDFGSHSYVWDGTDFRGERVGSGIYFYRFDFGGNVETRKMILLK
ncbi:MAG TPA: hypothetical protein PLG20_10230, partial [Candidatus Syntrophosphaera sp.]|nr:hypothetical protein [Candidatus Syntrophosphaera sp.]